jgi:hypothetical protein
MATMNETQTLPVCSHGVPFSSDKPCFDCCSESKACGEVLCEGCDECEKRPVARTTNPGTLTLAEMKARVAAYDAKLHEPCEHGYDGAFPTCAEVKCSHGIYAYVDGCRLCHAEKHGEDRDLYCERCADEETAFNHEHDAIETLREEIRRQEEAAVPRCEHGTVVRDGVVCSDCEAEAECSHHEAKGDCERCEMEEAEEEEGSFTAVKGERSFEMILHQLMENAEGVERVSTFECRGILTRNKGLCIELANGTNFQVTIVRDSRERY